MRQLRSKTLTSTLTPNRVDMLYWDKKYTVWHNITDVSLSQFTKPYIRKGNPNLSNRKLPYGLIHIRYKDKRLLDTIKFWIDEYLNNNGWAGTQVAKGGRL